MENGKFIYEAEHLIQYLYKNAEITVSDMKYIKDFKEFFDSLGTEDKVVLCGGDEELNFFANKVYSIQPEQNIYLYLSGHSNDFAHDVKEDFSSTEGLVLLNNYLKNLPLVTFTDQDGKEVSMHFLNGVGFGIDGYCCKIGQEQRDKGKDRINYAAIAVQGLLYKYKPAKATVTADGETKNYESVWIAPCMLGRYYGGGMKVAPEQNRLNNDKTVTCAIWHSSNKLKTLFNFPKIFEGNHVFLKDSVDIIQCHSATVEFEEKTTLQVDGIPFENVKSYTVTF